MCLVGLDILTCVIAGVRYQVVCMAEPDTTFGKWLSREDPISQPLSQSTVLSIFRTLPRICIVALLWKRLFGSTRTNNCAMFRLGSVPLTWNLRGARIVVTLPWFWLRYDRVNDLHSCQGLRWLLVCCSLVSSFLEFPSQNTTGVRNWSLSQDTR